LITNCVKHAFDGNDGTVEVVFSASPTQLFLRVHDNGRGLPDGFDPRSNAGSGMKIVLSLVRQLKGDLHIAHSGSGAHFDIVAPRELPVAQS
jgi:two-component sensor histidine kinase